MSAVLQPVSAARSDSLAAALACAARLLGHPVSVEALVAGLPLADGRLTPELVGRAAERAHLSAKLAACRLEDIPALALPAVLLLNEREACGLLGRGADAAPILPAAESEIERTVPIDELRARCAGDGVRVGRRPGVRAGTAIERIGETHHWFWGALSRSWR